MLIVIKNSALLLVIQCSQRYQLVPLPHLLPNPVQIALHCMVSVSCFLASLIMKLERCGAEFSVLRCFFLSNGLLLVWLPNTSNEAYGGK